MTIGVLIVVAVVAWVLIALGTIALIGYVSGWDDMLEHHIEWDNPVTDRAFSGLCVLCGKPLLPGRTVGGYYCSRDHLDKTLADVALASADISSGPADLAGSTGPERVTYAGRASDHGSEGPSDP